MALAYQRARGQAGRTRLIGRERGYHGTNFGGTAVGGIGGNRRAFGAQVWGVDHLGHTHRETNAFTRGQPDTNEDMAGEPGRPISLPRAAEMHAGAVEAQAGLPRRPSSPPRLLQTCSRDNRPGPGKDLGW